MLDDVNGPLGGVGLKNDAAVLAGDANARRAAGATEDLPLLLMRLYELRILPLQRPGNFPPLDKQYLDSASSPYSSSSGKLDAAPLSRGWACTRSAPAAWATS